MTLQQRIAAMVWLGAYIKANGQEWQEAKATAYRQNGWFTPEMISIATEQIASHFLTESALQQWAIHYQIPDTITNPKTVGIVMAGNIPLVGFHDFLCVWMSGHDAVIKASSKDDVLIKHLIHQLYHWHITAQNRVSFAPMLKGCDAYIATGSNNSSRYFEYYFAKYPSIIRKNRTSVAILNGTETSEELAHLANDIHLYFGLGCRNVTHLYVPVNYNFVPLIEACKKYQYFFDHHKYKSNYDYQLAILLLNNQSYMSSGSLLFTESASIFTPISVVSYSFYTDEKAFVNELNTHPDVQCIIGPGFNNFGKAQYPSLTDYADGIDTLQFLLAL
jgi:hypothetical protein